MQLLPFAATSWTRKAGKQKSNLGDLLPTVIHTYPVVKIHILFPAAFSDIICIHLQERANKNWGYQLNYEKTIQKPSTSATTSMRQDFATSCRVGCTSHWLGSWLQLAGSQGSPRCGTGPGTWWFTTGFPHHPTIKKCISDGSYMIV